MSGAPTIRVLVMALLLAGPAIAAPRAIEMLPPQLAGTYDLQNPFARIIRGQLPAAKVYEDAHVLAFMDNHPLVPGHVLVISKTSHARNLLEIEPRELARMLAVAQRVTRAEFTALGATGVVMLQNNGSAQSVFHLHLHVIPRYNGDGDRNMIPPEGTPLVPIEQLAPVAAKLAAAIRAQR
ncbi:HIT family protein [Sphingosinicellaceae bacterium]|nr:HIT family protein [Sphingosinicellaceae bacterium]